jgi:nitrogen fixation NifU-like protein
MSDLHDLYQGIILDHNKRPRSRVLPADPDRRAEGLNPLCGDEVTLGLKLNGDLITEIGFESQGCAISTASASLLCERIKGKTTAEAIHEARRLVELLSQKEEPDPFNSEVMDELGDVVALLGVRRFPARLKCATLPWHTLRDALLDGETLPKP